MLKDRPGLCGGHRRVLGDDEAKDTGGERRGGTGSAEGVSVVGLGGDTVVAAAACVIDGGDVDPAEADAVISAIVGGRGDADFGADVAELGVGGVAVGAADGHGRGKLGQRGYTVDGVVAICRGEEDDTAEAVSAAVGGEADRRDGVGRGKDAVAEAPTVAQDGRAVAVVTVVVRVDGEVEALGDFRDARTEELDADEPAIRACAAHADGVALGDRDAGTCGAVALTAVGTGIVIGWNVVEVDAGCPIGEQVGMQLFDALIKNGDADDRLSLGVGPVGVVPCGLDVDIGVGLGALAGVAVEMPLHRVIERVVDDRRRVGDHGQEEIRMGVLGEVLALVERIGDSEERLHVRIIDAKIISVLSARGLCHGATGGVGEISQGLLRIGGDDRRDDSERGIDGNVAADAIQHGQGVFGVGQLLHCRACDTADEMQIALQQAVLQARNGFRQVGGPSQGRECGGSIARGSPWRCLRLDDERVQRLDERELLVSLIHEQGRSGGGGRRGRLIDSPYQRPRGERGQNERRDNSEMVLHETTSA